ncbi:class I SAM-dependent methyltransferase [Devosia sp.]|jgi:SAM-dependent methyltransferase|uniref:class I SAM-dependent methyltransferase n=1 Tax=Devosia sp. TaxID=1871048 RepID=UPI0037BF5F83
MRENTYGRAKRVDFIGRALDRSEIRSVLDIGCGTGAELTIPLAEHRADTTFVAVDEDSKSIEAGRNAVDLPNLTFGLSGDLDLSRRFDAAIASEVLEHVESPEQFLAFLNDRLVTGGWLVLTTPNGYGPFEMTQIIETALWSLGVLSGLRRAKRALTGKGAGPAADDTLALSPHINFFSRRDVERLLANAGFSVETYSPRTFLCGFGFDHLLKGERTVAWNAKVADRLPSGFASDFMFVARKVGAPGKALAYRRGAYARWRGALNRQRMGL